MKNYKIAVAGTGYVGLSIATLLSTGRKTGFDYYEAGRAPCSAGFLLNR